MIFRQKAESADSAQDGRGRHFVSFQVKIFTSITIVALLTEVLVLAGFLSLYLRQEASNFYTQTDNMLKLLSDSVAVNVSDLEQGMFYRIGSSAVFSTDYDSSPDGEYLFQKNVRKLAIYLQQSRLPLLSVYCVRRDGSAVYYHDRGASFSSLNEYRNSEIFSYYTNNLEDLEAKSGGTWFHSFPDCPESVYIIKNVIDSESMEYQGLLILEVDQSYIRGFYSTVEDSYGCSIAFYTSDGELLSCDSGFADTAEAYGNEINDSGNFGKSFGNYLVTGGSSYRIQWIFAAFKSRSSLWEELWELLPWLFVMALFVGGVSLLIARRIASTQTRSIHTMISQIRRIQDGNPDSLERVHVQSNDEMSILEQEFNRMIDQLNASVQRMAYASVEKDRAEYNALMAQMDPHFLYNTLEGISSLARLHGEREIVECISRLSRLYRAIVHGDSAEITLREELSYVESYFELEKMIMGGRIDTVIDAEESLMDLRVPKLVIQPIVENSIRHGVEGMTEGGTVVVTAMLQNGDLYIEVSDNGTGMSQEKIEELMKAEDSNAMHVGIASVQRRIQILYGRQYGLMIKSGEEGTTVTIHLPAIRADSDIGKAKKTSRVS